MTRASGAGPQPFSYTVGNSFGALGADTLRSGGTALPQAPFAPSSIAFHETRSDGGFAWDVKYDLRFDGAAFTVETRIHLNGDDPGTLRGVWEQGIERVWNDKYCLTSGGTNYAIRFDVKFVEAGGQHYDVTVNNAFGRCDMLNWCTDTAWGPDYQDEIAAHEYGHMIGCFDEYQGGATYAGFTADGTLMSDLTETLRPNYMNTIDYYAELFSGQRFDIVEAPKARTLTGTAGADNLQGGTGNDVLNGLAGADQLMGGAGLDTLWGGDGRDTLRGGDAADALHGGTGDDLLMGDAGADRLWGDAGLDTLWGGEGADRFVFARGGGRDRIGDFNAAQGDRIELVSGMTYRAGSDGGGGTLLDFGNGDQIALSGIAPSRVSATWFLYA